MIVDLNYVLKNLDGSELKNTKDENLTLKVALCEALLAETQDNNTKESKRARYALVTKLNVAEGELDLSLEEAVLANDACALGWPALVYGQIDQILK